MKIGLEAYMTTKPTLETAIDRFDKKFIFIEDGDYATSSAFITDDGLNKYGLEDIKQFITQEQSTLEALVRKEERDRIIEILKCLYEGNDAPRTNGEIIDIINGEFIEPWRKQLKQTNNNTTKG